MISVENNQECFVVLWRRLERTRRLLGGQCKRYCIRNVLKAWFGGEATDDFIWEVCRLCEQEGWNELPIPSLYPLKHRELLRAVVAVRTGVSFWRINLKALDAAYSGAFPNSTPINKSKKKKTIVFNSYNSLTPKKMISRGIRNNNPLNVRRSKDKWQGMKALQTDASFVQFETMAYGWRAAFLSFTADVS